MIHFKLNSKKIQIASSWDDLKFRQYLGILNMKSDDINGIISLCSDIPVDSLKSSIIIGLESVIQAISFLNTPANIPGYTSKVGPYSLPGTKDGKFDIQFESLAQFEDMRQIMKAVPRNESRFDIIALTKAYAQFVSIYLQKIRDGKYDPEKAKSMIAEVEEMPALEVICAGSFFFLKLMSLSSGTQKASHPTNQTPKKSKQASKGSPKRSARTGRSRKRR